jgi:hypothetical protein
MIRRRGNDISPPATSRAVCDATARTPRVDRRSAVALAALLTAGALLSVDARVAEAEPARIRLPERARVHLFLLVGQSNMAGRGDIEPADKEPIANVVALDAAGEWVPAVEPLHWDKPSAGAGLGRAFAVEYAKTHPGITVGLIPAACGGSPIASWEPGKYFEDTKSHPYDDALARARRAMTSGSLQGILWHQGESDRSAERAPLHERALAALIDRFRHDLQAPSVPFVIGQLGQFPGAGPWDEFARAVDRAQRDVVARVPFTAFVSSDGLTSKPDNLHFDARSLRELGQRYASALAVLTTRRAAGKSSPVGSK